MKIRFFLIGTEEFDAAKVLETQLKYVFSDYIEDNGFVQSFPQVKDATAEIAKAISNTHVIVFIADTSCFSVTKQMLAKAFGFELTCDTDLLEKACKAFGKDAQEEDYDFSVTHAFIPKDSRVIALDDGKYTGFSLANGNQTVILIPYEKERTSFLLSSKVIPYINSVYHISIENDKFRQAYTEILADTLSKNELQIAVAGTNTASFFKEYTETEPLLDGKIKYSEIAEARGAMQPVDYVVNLSIAAAELFRCKYGVALSNAFYVGDDIDGEKIVYIAVSNDKETAVRELRSLPGEDLNSFLSRCSGNLCVFITDIVGNDMIYKEDYTKRESAAAGRYKKSIIAVSSIIVALVVFCVAFFYSNDYSFKQWGENFMDWVFPAGNPFSDWFSPNNGADLGAENDDHNFATGLNHNFEGLQTEDFIFSEEDTSNEEATIGEDDTSTLG